MFKELDKPLQLKDMIYIMHAEVSRLDHLKSALLLGCFTGEYIYGKIIVFNDNIRTVDFSFKSLQPFTDVQTSIELFQQYLINCNQEYKDLMGYQEYLLSDWTMKEKKEFFEKHTEITGLLNLRSKMK